MFGFYPQVWLGSQLMLHHIYKNQEAFRGQAVLELGSGTGLVGIFASRFAKFCVLSDGSPEAVALASKNIEINRRTSQQLCPILSQKLQWGCEKDLMAMDTLTSTRLEGQRFKVVMASDVIYDIDVIEPLLRTAVYFMDVSDGIFILSYVSRCCFSEAEVSMRIDAAASNLGLTSNVIHPRAYPTLPQNLQETLSHTDSRIILLSKKPIFT